MVEWALFYAKAGLHIFPLHYIHKESNTCTCNMPDCKSPGKHPMISNASWRDLATTNEETIKRWWSWWPEANIAVATGKASNICVLDFDNKKDGLAFRQQLLDESADLDKTLQAATGGGGYHHFFLADRAEVGQRNAVDGKGFDIRANGGYVVLPPSGHLRGDYRWIDNITPDMDPDDFRDLILPTPEKIIPYVAKPERQKEKTETTSASLGVVPDREKILSALDYIRPLSDDWLKVGMALYHEFGGSEEGYAIWDRWARTEPAYADADEKPHRARWKSFGNRIGADAITIATLYKLAGDNGWDFVDLNEAPSGFVDDANLAGGATLSMSNEQAKPTGIIKAGDTIVRAAPELRMLQIYSTGELLSGDLPKPDELWRGSLVFHGGIVLLAGAPKIGKSSFFCSFAMSAACGGEFLGERFTRACRVLWLQAEIQEYYLAQRLEAAIGGYSPDEQSLIKKQLYTTPRLHMLLSKPGDYSALANTVHQLQPDIIAIDPIINFADANENDNAEVMSMLRRAINLAKVPEKPATLVLVHHTRKTVQGVNTTGDSDANPFDAIRGAGAFRGIYDTGLMLAARDNQVYLHFEARNGKSPDPIAINMQKNGVWRLGITGVDMKEGERVSAKTERSIDDEVNAMVAFLSVIGGMTKTNMRDYLKNTVGLPRSKAREVMARLDHHPNIRIVEDRQDNRKKIYTVADDE